MHTIVAKADSQLIRANDGLSRREYSTTHLILNGHEMEIPCCPPMEINLELHPFHMM